MFLSHCRTAQTNKRDIDTRSMHSLLFGVIFICECMWVYIRDVTRIWWDLLKLEKFFVPGVNIEVRAGYVDIKMYVLV